ncbi:MAG: hypothetical protein J6J97_06165 [Akkermansia sp.]|nr:hypothetical protein [Akkermansia sp.]
MRTIVMLLALVVPAMAQEQPRSTHWGAGGQLPSARPAREDAHQRALRKYDANRDGKLDDAEREIMRKAKKSGRF